MTNLRISTAVLFAIAAAAPQVAAAQDSAPAIPTRMEVGGSVTFIETMVTGGPRVTFNFNSRHAVQASADLSFHHDAYGWETDEIYTVEYRYTLPVGLQATRIFITAGGLGTFGWYHSNAYTYHYPGYSYVDYAGKQVTAPPSEYERPAYTGFDVLSPVFPIVGGGVEHRLNSRLLARADAQFIFGLDEGVYIIPRVTAGIVVSLGKRVR